MRDPRWNARVKTPTTSQYTVNFGLNPSVSCTLSSPDVRVCLSAFRLFISATWNAVLAQSEQIGVASAATLLVWSLPRLSMPR
jgi:hypothetical protein